MLQRLPLPTTGAYYESGRTRACYSISDYPRPGSIPQPPTSLTMPTMVKYVVSTKGGTRPPG